MTSLGSVQRLHTRLRAIGDDTLILADGRPRAIFEVFPPDTSLADEALEAHTARLAAFLHGLTFPIQILLRPVPADLEAHACEVEAASAGRGLRIAAAGRTTPAWPATWVAQLLCWSLTSGGTACRASAAAPRDGYGPSERAQGRSPQPRENERLTGGLC